MIPNQICLGKEDYLYKSRFVYNSFMYRFESDPIKLEVSPDKRDIKVVNYSTHDFRDVIIALIDEKENMLPIYSFKDMNDICSGLSKSKLRVPDETYKAFKSIIDKNSTYYKVICNDSDYEKYRYMYAPMDKIKVTVKVPDWFFSDNSISFAWVWETGKDGRWVRCYQDNSSEKRIMFDVEPNETNIIINRYPQEKSGSPDWNPYNRTHEINLLQRDIFFYLNDSDFQ